MVLLWFGSGFGVAGGDGWCGVAGFGFFFWGWLVFWCWLLLRCGGGPVVVWFWFLGLWVAVVDAVWLTFLFWLCLVGFLGVGWWLVPVSLVVACRLILCLRCRSLDMFGFCGFFDFCPISSCSSSSPSSPSRDSQILLCDLGCLVCDPPFVVGKWIRLWVRRNVPSWYFIWCYVSWVSGFCFPFEPFLMVLETILI